MASRPGERLRILHLITRLELAGAQDNTLLTCEGHDRQRYLVDIASNPAGDNLARARAAADRFHPIRHLVAPVSPVNDLLAFGEIVALFKRERYDLVHLHSSKAGFLGRLAGRLTGTPCVFTYHGFPYNDFMPKWQRALYIGLERLARPWADYYGTLSENDRQEGIRRGFIPQDRSKVICTGIKLDKFAVDVDRRTQRRALGLADNEMGVVLVGRLDPQKAPDIMLRAFAMLLHRRPGASRLFFVGDGELRASAVKLSQQLGIADRVHFLGKRGDVPQILAAMDVFAFSSRWEAVGRAMLEAMICGLPVIAPEIYGIPEVVQHQKTGLLYSVGNARELADGLIWYFDHPRERVSMGETASAYIKPLFDHRAMVQSVEAMFEQVLASRASARSSQPRQGSC